MEKAITFDKVSKTYFTSKGKYGLLRDTLDEILFTLFKKNYHRKPTVIALKNVSFDVKRGEVVGIIGRIALCKFLMDFLHVGALQYTQVHALPSNRIARFHTIKIEQRVDFTG